MAVEAVSSESETAGGKESALPPRDTRFCAGVNISLTLSVGSTLENPIGDIVIDFGDGCTDPRGNVRKGKILIHFEGRRFLPGSVLIVTFENYFINGIELDGQRTLTTLESVDANPTFQVQLEGTITWPDGKVATRSHCFVRSWHRNTDSLLDDELHVVQSGVCSRGYQP
jgi:hypothetical protein